MHISERGQSRDVVREEFRLSLEKLKDQRSKKKKKKVEITSHFFFLSYAMHFVSIIV